MLLKHMEKHFSKMYVIKLYVVPLLEVCTRFVYGYVAIGRNRQYYKKGSILMTR
jgi:hypothetical protein